MTDETKTDDPPDALSPVDPTAAYNAFFAEVHLLVVKHRLEEIHGLPPEVMVSHMLRSWGVFVATVREARDIADAQDAAELSAQGPVATKKRPIYD